MDLLPLFPKERVPDLDSILGSPITKHEVHKSHHHGLFPLTPVHIATVPWRQTEQDYTIGDGYLHAGTVTDQAEHLCHFHSP